MAARRTVLFEYAPDDDPMFTPTTTSLDVLGVGDHVEFWYEESEPGRKQSWSTKVAHENLSGLAWALRQERLVGDDVVDANIGVLGPEFTRSAPDAPALVEKQYDGGLRVQIAGSRVKVRPLRGNGPDARLPFEVAKEVAAAIEGHEKKVTAERALAAAAEKAPRWGTLTSGAFVNVAADNWHQGGRLVDRIVAADKRLDADRLAAETGAVPLPGYDVTVGPVVRDADGDTARGYWYRASDKVVAEGSLAKPQPLTVTPADTHVFHQAVRHFNAERERRYPGLSAPAGMAEWEGLRAVFARRGAFTLPAVVEAAGDRMREWGYDVDRHGVVESMLQVIAEQRKAAANEVPVDGLVTADDVAAFRRGWEDADRVQRAHPDDVPTPGQRTALGLAGVFERRRRLAEDAAPTRQGMRPTATIIDDPSPGLPGLDALAGMMKPPRATASQGEGAGISADTLRRAEALVNENDLLGYGYEDGTPGVDEADDEADDDVDEPLLSPAAQARADVWGYATSLLHRVDQPGAAGSSAVWAGPASATPSATPSTPLADYVTQVTRLAEWLQGPRLTDGDGAEFIGEAMDVPLNLIRPPRSFVPAADREPPPAGASSACGDAECSVCDGSEALPDDGPDEDAQSSDGEDAPGAEDVCAHGCGKPLTTSFLDDVNITRGDGVDARPVIQVGTTGHVHLHSVDVTPRERREPPKGFFDVLLDTLAEGARRSAQRQREERDDRESASETFRRAAEERIEQEERERRAARDAAAEAPGDGSAGLAEGIAQEEGEGVPTNSPGGEAWKRRQAAVEAQDDEGPQ